MRSGPLLTPLARMGPGWVPSPSRGRLGTPCRGLCGCGFEPLNRQVGASAAGVGFGGEVRGGGTQTHRVRRRGCPRAHGPRAAWRHRVAGKVPDSGGRPAPRPGGPPCCALRPGAPPPHIGAPQPAEPALAVSCPAPPPPSPAGPGPAPAAGSERTPSPPPPTAGLFACAEGHSVPPRTRPPPRSPP